MTKIKADKNENKKQNKKENLFYSSGQIESLPILRTAEPTLFPASIKIFIKLLMLLMKELVIVKPPRICFS